MRITARLSTAGEGGFMSVPIMPHPSEYYVREDGTLDEALARRDLAENSGITMSSNDNKNVISLAIDLLERMKESMHRIIQSEGRLREKKDGEKATPAERRFNKGKFTFVRVDIRLSSTGFHIKVSADNPHNVVGDAEEFARLYAQAYADNLVAIADALKDDGFTDITFTEGELCKGIFADARKRNDDQMLRAALWDCDRRHNGHCSPCKFDCPLFVKGGKCGF